MIALTFTSAQQQTLYDMLRPGADVAIVELYLALGFDPARADEHDERSRSWAQSRVIQHVIRLNRRLAKHKLRVKPGNTKRTYCLAPLV